MSINKISTNISVGGFVKSINFRLAFNLTDVYVNHCCNQSIFRRDESSSKESGTWPGMRMPQEWWRKQRKWSTSFRWKISGWKPRRKSFKPSRIFHDSMILVDFQCLLPCWIPQKGFSTLGISSIFEPRPVHPIQEDLREGQIRPPPAGTGSRSPFCGDSEAHALILFGPSQSTKSTMVCQLRKSMLEKCPAVGDGSGESVTEWPELFDSILGPLLDTPGCFDTKLRFTSQEAAQRVAVAVAEANTRCLKFLVFDSMASDTMRLRDTLLTLFTVFGVQIRSSIVVIASRPNVKSPLEDAKRLELVRKTLEEQELNELVVWNISRETHDSSVPLVEAVSGSEHFLLDKLKNSLQRLPSDLAQPNP